MHILIFCVVWWLTGYSLLIGDEQEAYERRYPHLRPAFDDYVTSILFGIFGPFTLIAVRVVSHRISRPRLWFNVRRIELADYAQMRRN